MGMRRTLPDDLVTIDEYARMFLVDASVVRSWIKQGVIPFELVNGRQMRTIDGSKVVGPVIRIRPSDTIKPIIPMPLDNNRSKLKAAFRDKEVDEATTNTIVDAWNDTEVDEQLYEMTAVALKDGRGANGTQEDTQQAGTEGAEGTTGAGEGKSANRQSRRAARRNAKLARQVAGQKEKK